MIGSSKPLASLSSQLLARKGQAKPAMRPQGFVGITHAAHDDLGWNDMGEEPARPAPVLAPAPENPEPAPKPAVLRQREVLDETLAAPSEPEPVPAPTAPEPIAELAREEVAPVLATVPAPAAAVLAAKKAKAAFTLRLDADRHLRLRLASAVTNRSAQQLVTAALDKFLESLGEVDALARQVGTAKDRG
jgi:hypothetical protein